MKLGSLFSGYGGFELGFERAGFETTWQVEIDRFAQKVLRHRWPNVPLHSDVRDVGKHNLDPVDVITAGFPCQDLSVAGKRGGLAAERSGLFYEAVRVVSELRPRFLVLENVPGLLSSNGGWDFASVLDALEELGALDVAWRVLDAQHFGVPQRRRRIFLVADFGGERAGEILFEPEGVPGHPAPRREAGQEAAARVGDGAEEPRAYGVSHQPTPKVGIDIFPTLSGISRGGGNAAFIAKEQEPASRKAGQEAAARAGGGVEGSRSGDAALTSNYGKQPDNSDTALGPNLVISTGEAGQEAAARAGEGAEVAGSFAFALRGREEGARVEVSGDVTSAIRGEGGSGRDYVTHALTAEGFDASEDGTGRGTPLVPTPPAIAFDTYNQSTSDVSQALRNTNGTFGDALPAIAYALHSANGGMEGPPHSEEKSWTLDQNAHADSVGMAVRRLTPIECSRLQGVPDDHVTGVPGATDSACYRALGNGVAVPVVEWLAKRMAGA